ncbi:MAG: transcription termination/antitermination protein NusG [Candidatus Fermentibacteraceae bacterium]
MVAAPQAAPEGTVALDSENPNLKWYVVHSYSGYELRVRKFLEGPLARKFPGRVGKVVIPTEEITNRRNGKDITREKKLYPGYVFVQLEIDDEMILDIRGMVNVSGFPPMNKGRPTPLSDADMKRILGQSDGSTEEKKVVRISFKVGQTVRVVEGPFRNFTGVVESLNPERGKVRVIFTIFGRKAPVEIDHSQVRLV